jgi:hypothetical protein
VCGDGTTMKSAPIRRVLIKHKSAGAVNQTSREHTYTNQNKSIAAKKYLPILPILLPRWLQVADFVAWLSVPAEGRCKQPISKSTSKSSNTFPPECLCLALLKMQTLA